MKVVTTGLRFPEGPVYLPDGSIVLVEIAAGEITRVMPDGTKHCVARPGGGPNGAAMGPDGKLYVCNNGGMAVTEKDGILHSHPDQPADYSGGRIERIDLDTGDVEVLYTEWQGKKLSAPNDIVFDRQGGFWFTDHGKSREDEGLADITGVYYATIDGQTISREIYPSESPNGIGLSPDESTLYVAETHTGRIWSYPIESPGRIKRGRRPLRGMFGTLVAGLPGRQLLDSLAIDAAGRVCVATLIDGGITIADPADGSTRHVPTGDMATTNICFGGDDWRTAYITLSSTGQLVQMDWDEAGLIPNFWDRWQPGAG